MRKTTFVKPLSCCSNLFFLFALGLAALPAVAQGEAPAAAPAKDASASTVPTDPKALMLLALKTNSLTGPDVKPWRLKASYKIFDEQGNAKGRGIYEELWVSQPSTRAAS
jgi:hypothetical protein